MAAFTPHAPRRLISLAVDDDTGDVVISFQCEEDKRLYLFLNAAVASELKRQLNAKVKKSCLSG